MVNQENEDQEALDAVVKLCNPQYHKITEIPNEGITEIDSNILHIEVIFSLLSDPDSYESLTFNVKDNFTH